LPPQEEREIQNAATSIRVRVFFIIAVGFVVLHNESIENILNE
jgi:hypothetical protein